MNDQMVRKDKMNDKPSSFCRMNSKIPTYLIENELTKVLVLVLEVNQIVIYAAMCFSSQVGYCKTILVHLGTK